MPSQTFEQLVAAARAGDAGAQFALAESYEAAGRGDIAVPWLKAAAQRGDVLANVQLGVWQIIGHHVERKPQDGIRRITAAADAGSDMACAMLASACAVGLGVDQSWDNSLDWLVRSAQLGNARAAAQLRLLSPPQLRSQSLPWPEVRKHLDVRPFLSLPSGESPVDGAPIEIFRNVISPEVCDYVMQLATPGMQRAEVHDDHKGLRVHDMRTNSAMRFTIATTDVIVRLIEHQVAAISGLPLAHQEDMNVLRYLPGETYRPHFDFFDPQIERFRQQLDSRGQRVATVLIYLTDDYEGGHTEFPQFAFRFKGGRGDAIRFSNVDAANQPDRRMLHTGLPPASGEKWVISKWIHDRPQVDRGWG